MGAANEDRERCRYVARVRPPVPRPVLDDGVAGAEPHLGPVVELELHLAFEHDLEVDRGGRVHAGILRLHIGGQSGQQRLELGQRRADTGLEDRGGRSLRVSDTLAMGAETIHAIENPLANSSLAAIHVYGGDLIAATRSMWTLPDYDEAPYEDTKVLGAPIRQ